MMAPYQDLYTVLRAPDARSPPTFGHVTRVAAGVTSKPSIHA